MSEAWKQLDLDGDGLQTLSLKLAQQFKQRRRAYTLLLAFPIGLHRVYLEDNQGAWRFRLVFVLALITILLHHAYIGSALLILMVGMALYDIRWIDDRIASINKSLRMAAYRARPSQVPKGFRGRYVDDKDSPTETITPDLGDYLRVKEQERGGHVPTGKDPAYNSRTRTPSFAQQEAMLKDLMKKGNSSE